MNTAIVAFDVDNTLLDPDMSAYRAAVLGGLAACDLGVTAEEGFEAFEALRAKGNVLERIGLRNPIHDPGRRSRLDGVL